MYFIFHYVIILISSFILHGICCIETSSLSLLSTETSLNIEKASYCSIRIIAIPGHVKTWNSLFKWTVNFATNLEWFFLLSTIFLNSLRNSIDVQNMSRKFLMALPAYLLVYSSGNLTELFCWAAFNSVGFLINTFHSTWKKFLKTCQFFR